MRIKPVLVPDHDAASLRKLMDSVAEAAEGRAPQQLTEMDYGGGRSPHGGHGLPRDDDDEDAGKPEVLATPATVKKTQKDTAAALTAHLDQAYKDGPGVAEGLPQTLRKIVPGYAKREIDKKMDAGKFGKDDVAKDANYYRYKKIQDKIKEQGVAEGKDIENYHHTGPNADKRAKAHAKKLGPDWGAYRHSAADKWDNLHIVAKKHEAPDDIQDVTEGLRGTGNPGMSTPYDQGKEDGVGQGYDNPYNKSSEEHEFNEYKKGYNQGVELKRKAYLKEKLKEIDNQIKEIEDSGFTSRTLSNMPRLHQLDDLKKEREEVVELLTYSFQKQGVAEGSNDGKEDNFTIDDIKRLEQIRDFETLKVQAKELIKGKPVRRMKPEKISWFYNHIDSLKNPLAVIKMMYDLLLAGEGHKVIGSKNSMSGNSYRQRFGEQGVTEEVNRSFEAVYVRPDGREYTITVEQPDRTRAIAAAKQELAGHQARLISVEEKTPVSEQAEVATFKPGDRVMYMNTFATVVAQDGDAYGIKVDRQPGTMKVPASQIKKPSYDESVTESRDPVEQLRADIRRFAQ